MSESPLLTIDCGNSTVTCRRADGRTFVTASAAPDVAALVAFAGDGPLRAVAVSVVPAALAAVRDALAARGDCRLAVAGVDLPCPLPLAYETPTTLGADRWLGAFAAHLRCGRGAAVTVDCGSATTVNVVDGAGRFRGGAIAPGLGAFVVGMRATAPLLPPAELDARAAMPGRSTQAGVDAGVLCGFAGLVERLVADAHAALGTAAPVYVTGGHAARLLRHARLSCEHVPELLHDGLAALPAEGA